MNEIIEKPSKGGLTNKAKLTSLCNNYTLDYRLCPSNTYSRNLLLYKMDTTVKMTCVVAATIEKAGDKFGRTKYIQSLFFP